ncbi:hypothetical protein [Pseudoalteromonas denitrificans]|uniref:Uncharacterized protein n=1 Tax=Pseudoalteromonas denitrificans DSM 6059 TaxID=1123010 RepID=A0A1I1PD07_9GAMM|nr:hypothetical protein [Pseudoalteromonas denitrificans]SFD07784.1 hypothetical protein SAMN02745724_03400 [Pseudoalteromonas denitrificans DSM 6059]
MIQSSLLFSILLTPVASLLLTFMGVQLSRRAPILVQWYSERK